MLYLNEVKYDGNSFIELAIKKGMKTTEVIHALACATAAVKKALDLDCLDYKGLGLDKCAIQKLDYDARLCAVLNKIVSTQLNFAKTLTTLNKVGDGSTNIAASDNLVKISKDDTVAGYLGSKLVSTQPGTLVVSKSAANGDKMSLVGFVPLGAVIIIDGSRADAFDNTGKGKADTDCSCFAISNGQNGTRNRMGRFPRWATLVGKAGDIGGADEFKVALKNISAFELGIDLETSEYQGSGYNNLSTETIELGANGFGNTKEIVTNNGLISSNSFTHKHTVKGKISHAPNPNAVEAIKLLPLYIDELPIQRIL